MTGKTAFTFPLTYKLGGDLQINRMGYGAIQLTGPMAWGPPKDRRATLRSA